MTLTRDERLAFSHEIYLQDLKRGKIPPDVCDTLCLSENGL